MSNLIRKGKKSRRRGSSRAPAGRVTYETALYAIRSAQDHDAYIAKDILDTFLFGDSSEKLLQAIQRLHETFRMDGGDRKRSPNAEHFLVQAIKFYSNNRAYTGSIENRIAQTLAAYARDWDTKDQNAKRLIAKYPGHPWATEWLENNSSRWDYAWERTHTHDDVERAWQRSKRRLRGFPKLLETWKRGLTNQARVIVSRQKKKEQALR
jgi:hypothetical protein